MKKLVAPLLLSGLLLCSAAQTKAQTLEDIFNTVTGKGSQNNNTTGNGRPGAGNTGNTGNNSGNTFSNLSNTDISNGLKEALSIGAKNAANQLSMTNGFFGNAAVKILLPKEAQQVESTLRSIGMGSLADKAILAMNRAAEDAAKQAAPIFVNAITSISIQDGLNILRGGNNAATNYLKGKTTGALTTAFSPVIQKSLNKVGAPEIWKSVFSTYNRIARNKVNPDLTGYVTERALSGLFLTIADEEAKIRNNPAAQVTNLLQRVFGKK